MSGPRPGMVDSARGPAETADMAAVALLLVRRLYIDLVRVDSAI